MFLLQSENFRFFADAELLRDAAQKRMQLRVVDARAKHVEGGDVPQPFHQRLEDAEQDEEGHLAPSDH